MSRWGACAAVVVVVMAGCRSDYDGPSITTNHPAHPRAAHQGAPTPPSPFALGPPFLPLADEPADMEHHHMHDAEGESGTRPVAVDSPPIHEHNTPGDHAAPPHGHLDEGGDP